MNKPFASTYKQVVKNMTYVTKLIETVFNDEAASGGMSDAYYDEVLNSFKFKVLGISVDTEHLDSEELHPSDYTHDVTWRLKLSNALGLDEYPMTGSKMILITTRVTTRADDSNPCQLAYQLAYSMTHGTCYFRAANDTEDCWEDWESAERNPIMHGSEFREKFDQLPGEYWVQPKDALDAHDYQISTWEEYNNESFNFFGALTIYDDPADRDTRGQAVVKIRTDYHGTLDIMATAYTSEGRTVLSSEKVAIDDFSDPIILPFPKENLDTKIGYCKVFFFEHDGFIPVLPALTLESHPNGSAIWYKTANHRYIKVYPETLTEVIHDPSGEDVVVQIVEIHGDIAKLQEDKIDKAGGTMEGTIDMDGNTVTGLAAPVNPSDATTKEYVDSGLAAKQATLTFDSTPTANSTNPVTSGGVKTALDGHYITAGQKSDTTLGELATAEGEETTASGDASHAEGGDTTASGTYAHAEGHSTDADGGTSHAEGSKSKAYGSASHAEGAMCIASGTAAHAEGWATQALGSNTHTEGSGVLAADSAAHAEGAAAEYKTQLDATINPVAADATRYVLTSTSMTRVLCIHMSVALSEHGPASRIIQIGTEAGTGAFFVTENTLNSSEITETTHVWATGGIASGTAAHAEGMNVFALAEASHAEGEGTEASGLAAHAEGKNTKARGNYAHTAGSGTIAKGRGQNVFGEYNEEDPTAFLQPSDRGVYVEIVGNGSSSGERANARTLDWEGNEKLAGKLTVGAAPTNDMDAATKAYVDSGLAAKQATLTFDSTPTANSTNPVTSGGVRTALNVHYITAGQTSDTSIGTIGTNATAEGGNNNASGSYSHAEGYGNKAYGEYSHAEGNGTEATRESSHAEGYNTLASSAYSHAEGYGTGAYGDYAHAEGYETGAGSYAAHAEGNGTTASGQASHAEGSSTTAYESYSHAEGNDTNANGTASHAEGISTTTSGSASHAEGGSTTASGDNAHAEGAFTTAEGYYSHAEGYYTKATHRSQHVFGEYNASDGSTLLGIDRGNYVEIVGNGTADDDNARSNARTLDWEGNEKLAGKLTVGNGSAATGAPTNDADVTTKKYVDTGLSDKLNTSGGTLSGALNMNTNKITSLGTPSADTDASTKKYVDDGLSGKLNTSGGTMTGAINMGSKKITSLATPTDDADAATKKYVDDTIGNMITAIVVTGTTAPSDTRLLWIDTTADTGGLKFYNGTSWVHVPVGYTAISSLSGLTGPTATPTPLNMIFTYGATAPSDTRLLWIDTSGSTGGLKFHDGSSWVHVPVSYN